MDVRPTGENVLTQKDSGVRLFLLVCSIVCGLAVVLPFSWLLLQPLAITPWEAALAMEGVRFNTGLPLYEDAHATHLYGPLLTIAIAFVFKAAGFSLIAARSVFSFAGVGLALLLAAIVCRGKGIAWIFVGSLIFLALNWRTNFIFFSTQPDCVAALLAIVALLLWIERDEGRWRLPAALVLFLCAMLFKQTSAAFALIPVAHVLVWQRPLDLRTLVAALVPAAFLAAALCAIALGWPQLFLGIVLAPAALKVHYHQFFSMLIYFLATFPILFLSLFVLLDPAHTISRRERWIVSANIVLIPVSVWTTIKSGGGLNSLLFGYLAMTALAISQLNRLLLNHEGPSRRKMFRMIAVLIALLCSVFFQFEKSLSILFLQLGDERQQAAIELTRRLGPGVISPQDPTIAFRANGYIGRCLFLELDRHAEHGEWPPTLPEGMKRELAEARYVLEVSSYVPTPMFAESLVADGFHREPVPVLKNSSYTLWTR